MITQKTKKEYTPRLGKSAEQISAEIRSGRERSGKLLEQIRSKSLREEYERLGPVAYWLKYD